MARKNKEPQWYPGDLVIDANENVAERAQEGDGWYVLGWIDQAYPTSDLAEPLRRLVPVEADAPWLYRITYNDGSVKHGHARVLGPVLGHARARNTYWHKRPAKIERAPDPTWEDVTSQHIP